MRPAIRSVKGIAAAACAVAAIASSAAAAIAVAAPDARPAGAWGSQATLKPGSGTRHTRLTLSFRVPETTGQSGTVTRRDVVSLVLNARHHGRCVSWGWLVAPYANQGTIEQMTLSPGRFHGRSWCLGIFVGDVVQEQIDSCGPPQELVVCPQVIVEPQVIARFRFHIARR